ncbi:MAG TPA: alkene reductase [Gammaproteobacteria bacterium]|nr:alkene reductase [Gammaproteobacteria bacterium]
MQQLETLFQPYELNNKLILKNRIIMAPMSRYSAGDGLKPTEAMADYYEKRADAGLIITEGTLIRADAGHGGVPGIFTSDQINAWRVVTDKVHARGGKIFQQLWHVGRVSHPYFLDGKLPLAPSQTVMEGRVWQAKGKELFFGQSREATVEEIKGLVESYATAAKNAMEAGFDGVELHGANGFLIDQFLHHHTNHRTDNYGGTPEKMARFVLDVVKAVTEAVGSHRVGLRLSPGAYLNEVVGDVRDRDVFKYVLEQLNDFSLAYIHTGNFNDKTLFAELGDKTMTAFMREHYKGTLIASGSYEFNDANEQIKQEQFNLIAIGRPFIANPDLIPRLEKNQDIISYDQSMLATLR